MQQFLYTAVEMATSTLQGNVPMVYHCARQVLAHLVAHRALLDGWIYQFTEAIRWEQFLTLHRVYRMPAASSLDMQEKAREIKQAKNHNEMMEHVTELMFMFRKKKLMTMHQWAEMAIALGPGDTPKHVAAEKVMVAMKRVEDDESVLTCNLLALSLNEFSQHVL